MSFTPRRVTKGQIAAICGLHLIGLGFLKACRVVGIDRACVVDYVPKDWRRSPLPVPLRRMTPKQYATYRKMQPIIGRDRAFEKAVGIP